VCLLLIGVEMFVSMDTVTSCSSLNLSLFIKMIGHNVDIAFLTFVALLICILVFYSITRASDMTMKLVFVASPLSMQH